ncbi:MAG TPA: VCBS repeat-containing protein [Pirellulales bacterium]|nr:VCBS repeat-containing protein [Pirellulales bacterium]
MYRPTALKPKVKARVSGSAGFSLIFMSLFLTAAAIVMVSFLPGKEAGSDNAKTIDDVHKLEEVEEAMRSFMVYNRRRPCPADGQYLITSSNFGKEAAIAGTCQGGTPNAPLGPDAGTGNIVAGIIPTRSLGLPAEDAFDSYGRPFTYVVDKRATSTATCDALEGISGGSTTPTGKGGLYIKDAANNTIDQVMYAYIQHGPSGYGAWPPEGSAATLTAAQSAARRVNSGSTDAAMQIDAGVTVATPAPGVSDFAPVLTDTLVKNSMILPSSASGSLDTGFNDIVWYRDDLKNTCCLGKKCIPIGFRIDGVAGDQNFYVAGIGDINGDGIPDIIINAYPYIYVVFGTPTGWPIPPTGLSVSSLNGANGFSINASANQNSYAVADVNGDGYADLFICSYWGANCYLIFGGAGACQATTSTCGSSAPAQWVSGGTLNLASLSGYTGVNGTSGIVINMSGIDGAASNVSMQTPSVAVGKIDDSGYYSLIAMGPCKAYGPPWTNTCADNTQDGWGDVEAVGFVLYGMSPSAWASLASPVTVAAFNGTTGFEIRTSTPNLLAGHVRLGQPFDFDHDGFDDILISVGHSTPAYAHVLYGRSRAYWSASLTGTAPAFLDLAAELNTANSSTHCSSAVTCATEFYNKAPDNIWGGTLMGASLNPSTGPDLIMAGNGASPTIVFGGTRYPATFDLSTLTSSTGFVVPTATCCNGIPSWITEYTNAAVADVNGDGRSDLLLSVGQATMDGRSSSGGVLVYYQPTGGWSSLLSSDQLKYGSFHWDGTDSFQIYGPKASSTCGTSAPAFVGDVRPGDKGAPEIMVSCPTGETSHGSIYGLYKNKGWPSSIDLNQLN